MRVAKATLSFLFYLRILHVVAQKRVSGSMRFPFEIMRASANIDLAIDNYLSGKDEQPACGDIRYNLVQIINMTDNLEDVTFLAHPIVPAGTQLSKFRGTHSYNYAKNMFEAFNATVNECNEFGKTYLTTYGWTASDPFDAIALLKPFAGPDGQLLIAASGPLNEPLDTDDDINADTIFPDSFSLMTAARKVEEAISNFGTGQPVCGDAATNYIFCISAPENIDDTTFLDHPAVPFGTKLGDLAGTSDYDLGKGFIDGVIDALTIDDCNETGIYGLATYPWLNSEDRTTPVMVTSLVKDFSHPNTGERIICGSSPLIETAAASLDNDDLVDGFTSTMSNIMNDIVDSVFDLVDRSRNRATAGSDPPS